MAATQSQDRLEFWKAYEREVETLAAGQWLQIYQSLAPTLHPALERLHKHVPCPSHGGKDGFRLLPNCAHTGLGICNSCGGFSKFQMLKWVNGWDYGTSVREVGDFVGLNWEDQKDGSKREKATPRPAPAPVVETPKTLAFFKPTGKERAALRGLGRLIRECTPVNWKSDNPLTRYLANRGLGEICNDPPQDLLYHAELDYFISEEVRDHNGEVLRDTQGAPKMQMVLHTKLPAMVALVRDIDGEVVAAHRTWFTPEGKKPFAHLPEDQRDRFPDRKMTKMPNGLSVNGAAIRLYNANGTLGVGEGIETMLGARLLMAARQQGRRVPMWAAMNANGVKSIDIPHYVDEMFCFADHDEVPRALLKSGRGHLLGPGEDAAWKFRERMLDRGGARIFLPATVNTDWNDVLVAYKKREEAISRRFRSAFMAPEALAQLEREEAAAAAAQAALESPREAEITEAIAGPIDVPAPAPKPSKEDLKREILESLGLPAQAAEPVVRAAPPEAIARQAVAPWQAPLEEPGGAGGMLESPPPGDPDDPGLDTDELLAPFQFDAEKWADLGEPPAKPPPAVAPPLPAALRPGDVLNGTWVVTDRQLVKGKSHLRPISISLEVADAPRM